jgi:hypothetical protein
MRGFVYVSLICTCACMCIRERKARTWHGNGVRVSLCCIRRRRETNERREGGGCRTHTRYIK